MRPFIALAGGLSAAGHDVTLAVTEITNQQFSAFGERMNFDIRHVGHIDIDERRFKELSARVFNKWNPLKKGAIIVSNFLDPVIEDLLVAAKTLCAENDLVIGHFGSMIASDPNPREITQLLIKAVRLAGCRAIIQSNWDELDELPEFPEIKRVINAPHHPIFPHCAVVIHHGGAGTSQAATIAGCPSIVVEHSSDQPLWGSVLQRIGIPRNFCTGDRSPPKSLPVPSELFVMHRQWPKKRRLSEPSCNRKIVSRAP